MRAQRKRSVFGNIRTTLSIGLLIFGYSCSGYKASLIELVPGDSCAVVIIDWSSVRNDTALNRLIKGDQFELRLQHFALDSSTVKTAIAFSAINAHANAGLLVRGSFDKQKQISVLKSRGWQQESVDGHSVYVNGKDYVALPQDNTLFAGTREGAAAVFRTTKDSRQSFPSSAAYKRITEGLNMQSGTLHAFLVIPQGTLDMADAALETTAFALTLFNLGGVGKVLQQITIAHGFGLIIGRRSSEFYPVEMGILMRDERTASLINGSLNLLKGFSSKTPANDRTAQAFRSMNISRKGEVLTLKIAMPQEVLFPPSAQ